MATETLERGDYEDAARQLTRALDGRSGLTPHAARTALVALGPAAIAPLLAALKTGPRNVRWEAAKGLGELRRPEGAPTLVDCLVDGDPEIRWLAAEGLMELGQPAIVPLLRALLRHSESAWLRAGAHHVLHAALKGPDGPLLRPVVRELDGVAPAIASLPATNRALAELERAPAATATAGRAT